MVFCSVGMVVMETSDPVLRRLPGKLRAPMVLLGGVVAMLSFGSVYTFGNMLPYMVSYLRWKVNPTMTAGSMIWLQTLMSGVPFAMVVGGIMERKLGGRRSAVIGAAMYTGGVALTFFSIQHSFVAVLLSMGLFASFGGSIAYNAILTTAQRWMPDSVGLAGGLIVGGYGCGAFILSPLQTTFINPLDYRVNEHGFFEQEDLLERVPYVFLVMSSLFFFLQVVGLTFVGAPTEVLSVETQSLVSDRRETSVSSQLSSSTFLLLFVSLTCNALWVQLVSGLYKAFGQRFIASDLFLSFVGSMASIFNASSRVGWGLLVDKSSYQSCMAVVTTMGAALVWLLPAIQASGNHLLFLAAVCAMFSCIGGTFSLFPFITHKCFGRSNFGVVYGVLQCALTVAGVFAGLLSQFLLPLIGYSSFFLLLGSFMFISLILTASLHWTDMATSHSDYSIVGAEDEND